MKFLKQFFLMIEMHAGWTWMLEEFSKIIQCDIHVFMKSILSENAY